MHSQERDVKVDSAYDAMLETVEVAIELDGYFCSQESTHAVTEENDICIWTLVRSEPAM